MITDYAPLTPTLRGQPRKLAARRGYRSVIPREDGTVPGPGYFGEVYNTDDPDLCSTECTYHLRIRVPVRAHGKTKHVDTRTLVPLLVPMLDREEIAHLVDGGDPTPGITTKAMRHAEGRLAVGLPVFAQAWETPIELPAGNRA